ncbi:hypothetical protein J7E45_16050 [Microbacterium sp. ISL-59]|uniref:hypothetical protein n=1 Tax=Microbacterium sp. ISL-59 TaxID=2819159 RepID=UPI001BE5DCC6|nr:hypothetical protein [Microbacterium sp. ISL-59]MBT2497125.1 hypothetical protein [Microbacterium sp. ISL-59]
MWSKIVFWLRLGAAVFAGVAAILGVYNHYAPAKQKLPEEFEPITWGIALGIVMFDNVGTLISRKVHAVRSGRRTRIEKALMSMIINLAKTHTLPFDEIGASVYVPYWRDVVMRRPLAKVRLKRIIRFRPAGYPLQSGVNWRAGKGMVGYSWESRSSRYLNTHAIAKAHGHQELTAAQFARLSKDTRCGFTVAEFNAIAGKYSEVRAEPLWHGRKERTLVGVLSIDRAYIDEDDRFSPKLDKKQTREVAAAAASMVSDILKPRVEEA